MEKWKNGVSEDGNKYLNSSGVYCTFVGLLFPKIEIQYKDTIKFQIIGLISLLIEKDWE